MSHVTRSQNSDKKFQKIAKNLKKIRKNSKKLRKLLKLQIEIFIKLVRKRVNIISRHIKSEDSHWARRKNVFFDRKYPPEVAT